MNAANEREVRAFVSALAWERWLAKQGARSAGCWLRIFKGASGKASVTYAEALDAALGYGWIDGQKKSYDEASWLQKFTPRRPRSVWSKKNTKHAQRLIRAGKIKPAGLREVEAAKRDGRWTRAYDSPSTAQLPEDFLQELGKNKRAKVFFATLNKRNTYAIIYRLQSAKKPETRTKRMKALLAMLARGEKLYP